LERHEQLVQTSSDDVVQPDDSLSAELDIPCSVDGSVAEFDVNVSNVFASILRLSLKLIYVFA